MPRKKIFSFASIYTELLVAFVLVVLAPTILISAASAWSSYQLGRQRTLDQMDSIATLKTAEINTWTKELDVSLETLLSEREVNRVTLQLLQGQLTPAARQQAHDRLLENMNLLASKTQLFSRLSLLDAQGRVIVSTDAAQENLDLSAESYYQQGLQKNYISAPFHDSPTAQRLIVVAARPVVTPEFGAVGLLVGYSDISVLDRIMAEPMNLGQTGESYLVGANYVPLTQLRFHLDSPLSEVKSESARLAIETKTHGYGTYRDYHGASAIGVYTWLPTLQVALIVEQDEAEVFGIVATTLLFDSSVTLVAIALTMLVAVIIARRIARPVAALSAAATQIAAGDLNRAVEINRADEIGKLAQAFNHMTAQVRTLIQNLQSELTERARAEEALRESEERYKTFFEKTSDAVFLYDLDTYAILDANEATSKIYGYDKSELIGMSCLKFSAEVDKSQAVGEQIRNNGHAVIPERHHRKKNGSDLYVHLTGDKVTVKGREMGFSVCRNITERKQAEEQLAFQASLLEQVHNGVIAIDFNNKILYWNQFAEELYQWKSAEVVGRDIVDLLSPAEMKEAVRNNFENLRQEGHWEGNFNVKRKDGSTLPTHIINTYLKDLDGNNVGFIGISMDITERQRAEREISESEKRFRTLFEQAAVGVALLETQTGRYVRINQKYCDFVGYTIPEMLERSLQDVTYPEDTESNINQNALLVEGSITEFSLEKRYIRKDGKVVWGNLTVSPLWKPGEKPGVYYHIAVVEDITERKRAEEEIKQLNAHLEQRVEERTRELMEVQEKLVRQEKLAVLGQMAGSVGHELRNPLGVVSNAIYYLKMAQPEAPDKVKEYLDLIQKNIHIADKIIGDLLDFTRVKSLDRASVSAADVIHRALKRYPAPESIQVVLDIPADLPNIYADPQHIIQIIGNLTLNACQAMNDGGTLTISASAPDQALRIAIQDTGTGITPENMKKLFEPLFTTKAKGIGLGLAVCKKLIEANDGWVEVASEVGKGSVFTLCLPIHTKGARQ